MRPSTTRSCFRPASGDGATGIVVSRGSGRRLLARGTDQRADTVGHRGAGAGPVVDSRKIELKLAVLAARDRVEEPDLLQHRPALPLAAVRDDDVIERRVLASTARQTNR